MKHLLYLIVLYLNHTGRMEVISFSVMAHLKEVTMHWCNFILKQASNHALVQFHPQTSITTAKKVNWSNMTDYRIHDRMDKMSMNQTSQMWCDLGESVGSRTSYILSFLFDWNSHWERYILLKTPPESDQWFQSYWKILKTIEKKRNVFFFLVVSHNQCSWLPIDPATQMCHVVVSLCNFTLWIHVNHLCCHL